MYLFVIEFSETALAWDKVLGGLKKVTTPWLIVRHSTSISSRGVGKQKALRHNNLDPEFGIQSQIIPESNPSFACFFLHALSHSSVKALPHRIAMRWHEITHVKSTLAITGACSTLPGARGCSRAFHLILIQSEKEGAFFFPHILYLLGWKPSTVHKMFSVVDLNFVHTDLRESDTGFLCSGLYSGSAIASCFISRSRLALSYKILF